MLTEQKFKAKQDCMKRLHRPRRRGETPPGIQRVTGEAASPARRGQLTEFLLASESSTLTAPTCQGQVADNSRALFSLPHSEAHPWLRVACHLEMSTSK